MVLGPVLVVEDDDDLREGIAEVLRDRDIDVIAAADGAEAMEQLKDVRPSVVLLDLMMPIMDGWEVAEAMQADPDLADIPVCVMSAVAHKAPTTATEVLTKPVSLAKLLAVVEKYRAA